MLRASAQTSEEPVDLEAVVAGDAVASGIPGDKALLAFAETGLGDDAAAIADARRLVAEELGQERMLEAAAIIANFQRMVRIADGTGIQLDARVVAVTTDLRADLGLNEYRTARLESVR